MSKLKIFKNLKKKKKRIVSALEFLVMEARKNIQSLPVYVCKSTFKRHVDLLLMGEKGKRHSLLIKYIYTSCTIIHSYIYTQYMEKNVCSYCLQDFSTMKILKSHVNDCCKIDNKQMIKML